MLNMPENREETRKHCFQLIEYTSVAPSNLYFRISQGLYPKTKKSYTEK